MPGTISIDHSRENLDVAVECTVQGGDQETPNLV